MIDAHFHIWELGRHGCAWPTPELTALHRDHTVPEMAGLARPLGVTGGVLVQSQPCDADTDFLLDVAEREPFVRGVVGWVDLKAADAPERIAQLATRPKLRGLRPMLQSLPEDWIADPAVDPGVRAMAAHGLTFDALVFTRHLPALRTFARRHPDLPIVIDHGAKPPIAAGDIQDWARQMRALTALPYVHCKLSGLLTEAGPGASATELAPYVDTLLTLFGPARLMWGGDWPVLNLVGNCGAGTYGDWLAMANNLTEAAGTDGQRLIFGETARAFYTLT